MNRGLKRILVVDDDPSIRFMLRLILEGDGHEVLEAQHGAAALELLEGELPDLVVTDLGLPGRPGQAVIAALRADRDLAGIPILVVSGNPNPVAGADGQLAKPFRPRALLELARRMMGARPGVPNSSARPLAQLPGAVSTLATPIGQATPVPPSPQ